MRYNPDTGVYRDCRWCNGRGCVSCKIEADKAYKAAFPDGPVPIATFDRSDTGAMDKLRQIMSQAGLQDAQSEADTRAQDTFDRTPMLRQLTSDCPESEVVDYLGKQELVNVLTERIQEAGKKWVHIPRTEEQ